ncbi:MAG: hypothetical protein R8N23_20355 [Reichenbachiella sp.]|uniref:hypothetical protein n=1 Tax=Reichenbachiella sp. TaxID=2184521 RepID=UPI002965E10C|nr:hypothetical protein [Reichenbachiella sp.]MDW3212234.1 hypothetical protein [Reichenbachiella sp.]
MRLSRYYSSDVPFGTKIFMAPTTTELNLLKENWIYEMEKRNLKIAIVEGPFITNVGKSQNGGNCTLSFRFEMYHK